MYSVNQNVDYGPVKTKARVWAGKKRKEKVIDRRHNEIP